MFFFLPRVRLDVSSSSVRSGVPWLNWVKHVKDTHHSIPGLISHSNKLYYLSVLELAPSATSENHKKKNLNVVLSSNLFDSYFFLCAKMLIIWCWNDLQVAKLVSKFCFSSRLLLWYLVFLIFQKGRGGWVLW